MEGNLFETSTDKFLVASRTWNTAKRFAMFGIHYSQLFTVGFGKASTAYTYIVPNTANNNERYLWTYKNKVFSVYDRNNVLVGISDITSTDFGDGDTTEIRLFFGYNSNSKGRISYYHHKKADDTEINLIPCRRLSDNISGMYDTVSRTFFTNSGTGQFLVGPDVENNGAIISCEFPQTIYGGYVDLVSGELVETHAKYADSGSGTWSKNSGTVHEDSNSARFEHSVGAANSSNSNSTNIPISDAYCNYLKPYQTGELYSKAPESFGMYQHRLYVRITDVSEVVDLKAYFEENPLEVVYPLATPLTHQLTPRSLRTLVNQNTFWTDADRIEIEYELIDSAEMMDVRRRIILGECERQRNEGYPIGTLKYWMSGKDAPVDSGDGNGYCWVDRVAGLKWKLNYPNDALDGVYDSVNKKYTFIDNTSKYASLVGNANNRNIAFGNHFRVYFDIDIDGSKDNSAILDIGSVGNASKAIGFVMFYSDGIDFFVNWKMQGNASNTGKRIINSGFRTNEIMRVKGYYEIVDGGDGYDRFKVLVNGQHFDCNDQIPQLFYGNSWSPGYCYIARGTTNNTYHAYINIRELKIYQID